MKGRTPLVTIFGAGSAGTHLAKSATDLGMRVEVIDTDPSAPERFSDLCMKRYRGQLPVAVSSGPAKPSNYYFIATPPDTHLSIVENLSTAYEWPLVLIEKPICVGAQEAARIRDVSAVMAVNYNHLNSPSYQYFRSLRLFCREKGKAYLDVRWKESVDHILAAHPWIPGIKASYLSSPSRGGGSAYEHSHGLAFAVDLMSLSRPPDMVNDKTIYNEDGYDISCVIEFQTPISDVRVETDFTTTPAEKTVALYHGKFWKKLDMSHSDYDVVTWERNGGFGRMDFSKTRAGQFTDSVSAVVDGWDIGRDPRNSMRIGTVAVEIISEVHSRHREKWQR